MAHKKQATNPRDIVTLTDLAPRRDITGGSQRRVFGADAIIPSSQEGTEMKSTKASMKRGKDLSPKRPSAVKGGGDRDKIAANDNVTLVRATRPSKAPKDLPPRRPGVKGGGVNLNDNITMVRGAKPTSKKKDLPARKDVTGGKRIAANDNITIVRGAKPTSKKKDLPARKDVKGGKRIA